MESSYTAGVLFAVASGVCNNLGLLLQKRAVDRIEADGAAAEGAPTDRAAAAGTDTAGTDAAAAKGGFFARLLRHPLWLLGLVMHFGVGTVLFLLAQVHIGPALIPGLMASGLIVLVLGSLPITGDRLGRGEIAGVVLIALGIALLGLSRLAIDLREYDVLSVGFLQRATLFTAVATLLLLAARMLERRRGPRRGMALALLSGFLYVLSNFWVGPFVGVTMKILERAGTAPHYLMFIFCSAVLVLTNLFGIGTLQSAFRHCKAAQAIPIQNIPVQTAPAFVYLAVFRLAAPTRHSVSFLVLAIALILSSSFLLAGRQARLESESKRAGTPGPDATEPGR